MPFPRFWQSKTPNTTQIQLPVDSSNEVVESLERYLLRHPEHAPLVFGRLYPNAPTRENSIAALRSSLAESPEVAGRIVEQINPTAIASSPTQEDWYWGRLATGGEEDYFWRRLSDNFYQKDVIPSTYLEIHNQCYEAYNANPLAFAIVEMTTNFVLGQKLTISAKNKRAQQVIDAFWKDPQNHMDTRVYSICTELSLYGEQFIRFFVNKYDGTVYIRQVDPSLIDQIETDPDDIERELRFHRRPIGPSATLPGDPAPIIAPQDDKNFEGMWFSAGDATHDPEVVHFAINKVSNAKRGHSDLATLLPWLRRYKDWLTDRVRINKYKGAFLWDVTLKGADKKVIMAKQMEYAYPPEPGTVTFHNESEEWKAVQPQINANDAYQDGRAIKLMVAVGSILPEHYLSDGSEGNQATATQMGLPTLLKFQRRQKIMESIIRCILDRVIKEAKQAGTLPGRASEKYDLLFPELEKDDNQLLAAATQAMVAALTNAKANGWISDETAMQLMFHFAGQEVNVHEELERILTVPQGQPVYQAAGTSNTQQEALPPVPPARPGGQGNATQEENPVPQSKLPPVKRDPNKATMPAVAM